METISFNAFRTKLPQNMDKVNADHQPLLITRENAKPVVMLSLEDFQKWAAQAYTNEDPANTERLVKALAEVDAGKIKQRSIFE